MFVEWDGSSLQSLLSSLPEEMADYKASYTQYFEENKTDGDSRYNGKPKSKHDSNYRSDKKACVSLDKGAFGALQQRILFGLRTGAFLVQFLGDVHRRQHRDPRRADLAAALCSFAHLRIDVGRDAEDVLGLIAPAHRILLPKDGDYGRAVGFHDCPRGAAPHPD